MFELDKKYKRGRKTLIYLFVRYGWWLTLIGVLLFVASWEIYYGKAHSIVERFLLSHQDWYISPGMLAEWSVLLGIAFIFVAYLRANVLHRYYKFILDKHAFHLHRGWFSIRETTIPYYHISNVHIARPYHYRIFGIVKLDIVTTSDRDLEKSGDSRKKFLIPVIDKSVARVLAKYLLENASKSHQGRRDDIYLEEDDENHDIDKDDSEEDTFDEEQESDSDESVLIESKN